MERLFAEPLFYIFLIYGIAFLLLAWLVAKGAAGSSVPLIGAFNMLALFGLIHGITEMTDWIRFVRKTLGAPDLAVLGWVSQVCLVVSFVVLLQFAVNLFTAQSTSGAVWLIRLIPAAALVVFVLAVLAGGATDIFAIGLLGRHTFGFAAGTLAALALIITANTLSALGDDGLVNGLYVAAAAFALYAVFGGILVKPLFGAPIQLYRSACAVTIALASFSLIRLSSTVGAPPTATVEELAS